MWTPLPHVSSSTWKLRYLLFCLHPDILLCSATAIERDRCLADLNERSLISLEVAARRLWRLCKALKFVSLSGLSRASASRLVKVIHIHLSQMTGCAVKCLFIFKNLSSHFVECTGVIKTNEFKAIVSSLYSLPWQGSNTRCDSYRCNRPVSVLFSILGSHHLLKWTQQHLNFLHLMRRAHLTPPILTTFYRGTSESVLSSCISVWFGSSRASEKKSLQSGEDCREDHRDFSSILPWRCSQTLSRQSQHHHHRLHPPPPCAVLLLPGPGLPGSATV